MKSRLCAGITIYKSCFQKPDSVVIRLLGNTDKLDDAIEALKGYEILEVARTGLTGLSRGSDDVLMID